MRLSSSAVRIPLTVTVPVPVEGIVTRSLRLTLLVVEPVELELELLVREVSIALFVDLVCDCVCE